MRNKFLFAVSAAVLVLAGCESGGAQDPAGGSAEIYVEADAVRIPNVELYKKAHPEVKIRAVTSAGDPMQKILLANKAGKGWPDVVFFPAPEVVAQAAGKPFEWAAPLDDYVSKDVLKGFPEGTISSCTFGGKVYCLQNDLAQTVLWYDATLMKEFGYQVPKTWAEYQELGRRVAREHPDHVIGAFGAWGMQIFYESSGCPTRDVVAADAVHINLMAPQCTRVNELLQPLLDNKTVSQQAPVDPGFIKLAKEKKVLMLPGPSWFGDFVFKPAFELPQGRLAAAAMPTWPGEDKPYAGVVGGGVWAISKHAVNKKAAADLITWLTTDTNLLKGLGTYPAYGPAVQAWSAGKASDAYYAESPIPALSAAAASIRPGSDFVRFSITQPFDQVIKKGVQDGKKLADLMQPWQDAATDAATRSGYTVQNTP